MIHRDSLVVRASDLVSAPMGHEMAIMDMATGAYFVLDDVAAAIWDRIETPTAVHAICETLRGSYDVPAARCEADVLPFLESLRRKQLLCLVDGDA
jgi:hypothetical protein